MPEITPKSLDKTRALVLFSGGQDSATCLVAALAKFDHVETIGFHYGQRHHVELEMRHIFLSRLRESIPVLSENLGSDHIITMPGVAEIGETAMTSTQEITFAETGLPTTFVPGRNLLFFTYAGALAYRRGCGVLVGGMCETDYSGYPDCRAATLKKQQETLSLGMDVQLEIETPLMYLDKAATWGLAHNLGGDVLINLMIEATHTCYLGERTTRHDWGYGCGTCPACDLRKTGFERWKQS